MQKCSYPACRNVAREGGFCKKHRDEQKSDATTTTTTNENEEMPTLENASDTLVEL